jgi:IS1 family transposase/transposase-like protein
MVFPGGKTMRKAQNWNQPCPDEHCEYYGQVNKGNISCISSYMTKSGKRRIFRCSGCEGTFSETRDTVFFDLRTPEEKVMMALKMILVRVELSGISFVLGVKEETVLTWLDRASKKAEEINKILLKDLPVTEVQLDEMWTFVRRKISKQAGGEAESPQEADDGRQWIWVSYAPEFRLILAMVVGPRTFETALTLIQITARIVLGIPCFFSDGFSCYMRALIECYGKIKVFPRTGQRGRTKDPIKEPHPDLVYGQVVKERKGGRIIKVTHRIKCGAERLAQLGLKISTTLLERLNLTIRESLAPLARKTLGFSKERKNLRKQTLFFQAFYNFARPHMSLREKASETTGAFEQKWTPRTPAMAAGLTDHVWTFRELLTVKLTHAP